MVALIDVRKAPLGDAEVLDFSQWGDLAYLLAQTAQNSPYLSRQIEKEGEWLRSRAAEEAETVLAQIRDEVDSSSEADLMRSLRVAKARTALYLALMDLGGAFEVMEVTRALSHFADFAVEKALRFALKAVQSRRKLPDDVLEKLCGIFALAMGKGGAFELNYSSDIDLIFFYQAEQFEGGEDIRKGFIRAVQLLVKILSESTKDGYVFRVDLRLRPDPSVTPVVISTDQALGYYESLGRTWERAAFIKARACAGDIEAGEAFLREMRPFVWRKHLDFAAIEDAHNMRLRIREHKGLEGPIALEGHDLKLGRGGIREIEFFTQTRQLIFGGRNENLRERGTLNALDALASAEIIELDLARYLQGEYLWLRRLEHCAQTIDDRQTHEVPQGENLGKFLGLVGAQDRPTFEAEFVKRLQDIDETMERFFAGTEEEKTQDRFDFGDVESEMMEGWMSLPALRSERARTIFARLKPQILAQLSASINPQEALRNFDRFLRGLPSGVQLFSLFEANPALLDLLAEICALAPNEARLLGENHHIFEAVLSPDFFAPLDADERDHEQYQEQLSRELKNAHDYESILDGVRRFAREAQFRVSVHLLRDLAPIEMIARSYSLIADLALEALYPAVRADMERRYGAPPGRGMITLAMGKLGSRELTRASDLDLVMIYDAVGVEYSEGKRSLASSQYYSRFTQNFIQAISVATSEGALYEVDMRLRPSGRGGPVAVSLSSFAEYQLNEAWTWEHMALLRARVVAGDELLGEDVMRAAQAALGKPREKLKISQDVLDMREKIRQNFTKIAPLSLKHGAGRMMETELMLQGFALLSPISRASNSMSDLLEHARSILNADEHERVGDAMRIYGGLMQLARLSFAGEMPERLPRAWLARQEVISNVSTQAELEDKLRETSDQMAEIFDNYYQASIGEPQ